MNPLRAGFGAALSAMFAAAIATAGPPLGHPPEERGVALGLFSADSGFDYQFLLEEIRALRATDVLIAWVWWQDDVRATAIAPRPGWSATDAQVAAAIGAARGLGLRVTAMPILRLVKTSSSEWRGQIAPADEDRWWASYDAFILRAATLARGAGARRFAVGSELLSREAMRARWLELIERVRLAAPDVEVMYSANWDHYREVSFWDAVDVVGVTGYFELTRKPGAAVEDLAAAWAPVKIALGAFSRALGRPLVFTEIGYPSLAGAAAFPWDETRAAPIDLEGQRRAYEAVARAWSGVGFLRGLYWWNWFGFGGGHDGSYTPRGKPAAAVVRRWFEATRP